MEPPNSPFRTSFSQDIFATKYAHEEAGAGYEAVQRLHAKKQLGPLTEAEKGEYAEACATHWKALATTLSAEVVGDEYFDTHYNEIIAGLIGDMKFIPGGRYLYYAGRPLKFYNNCFLLRAEEDTREEWGRLSQRAISCLMTGGGIGIDYSVLREKDAPLKRTGGKASGPLSLIEMINEIGRRVMQGGSRRSAIYASLNWTHPDAGLFLKAKDWYNQSVAGTDKSVGDLKEADFNYHAPLDMTNISLNYDNEFLRQIYGQEEGWVPNRRQIETQEWDTDRQPLPQTFLDNVRQALKTGEPGFSFNFFDKENETLRNACTEVTSEDDSDVCNLGSLNMANFETIEEFAEAVYYSTVFLLMGTLRAELPYYKVYRIREKNRRLGLGVMGVHEWLMKRGYRYEVVEELHQWLQVYQEVSDKAAMETADCLRISRPVAVRAVAPTGTIGIMAGTTTGIEPLFAVAFKRRYLRNGTDWHYQYVIDGTARMLIDEYTLKPDDIETALDLAADPERRIKFQYDVQKYVDQSISSTINLPSWGSDLNNEHTVEEFARTLAKYAHGLRGFTCYPDGSRGGQPLTPVSYYDALAHEGEEFREEAFDVCDLTKGGTCGV
jgi:ribonucleoside-diphosphate reductase alpha chain